MEFQDWCDKFMSADREPMSEDMSKIYLSATMAEMGSDPIPDEIKNEFLYKVISRRAEVIGLSITDWANVVLMFLTQSPGSAIMYLYAMRNMGAHLNVEELAHRFPAGFLTEESMETMWHDQKIEGKNMLDMLDAQQFKI